MQQQVATLGIIIIFFKKKKKQESTGAYLLRQAVQDELLEAFHGRLEVADRQGLIVPVGYQDRPRSVQVTLVITG